MLINVNELVKTQTNTIKEESVNLILSQNTLQTSNRRLLISQDTMMSYLGGNITVVYEEIEQYVQSKIKLLCNVIEETANNNASYALEAEVIDEDAGNKALRGEK